MAYSLQERINLEKFISHFEIDCIFDVGANRGQFATMLRKKVGYKGKIISFEPVPECVEYLRFLSKDDENWIVEDAALSDESGTVSFNIMEDTQFSSMSAPNSAEQRLFGHSNKVSKELIVRSLALKDEFDTYKQRLKFRRPYLKMDTQGNDLKVVKGCGEKLKEFVALQSELAIVPIYKDAPELAQASEYYMSIGFNLTAIFPNNHGHFPKLIEADCIMYNRVMYESLQRTS